MRRKDEEEQEEEEESKEGQATQVIEEQEDEGEMINTQRGGKDVFTATTLTQLPDHFRRYMYMITCTVDSGLLTF